MKTTDQNPKTTCCDEPTLVGYLDNDLAPDATSAAARHVSGCRRCDKRLEQIRKTMQLAAQFEAPAMNRFHARGFAAGVRNRLENGDRYRLRFRRWLLGVTVTASAAVAAWLWFDVAGPPFVAPELVRDATQGRVEPGGFRAAPPGVGDDLIAIPIESDELWPNDSVAGSANLLANDVTEYLLATAGEDELWDQMETLALEQDPLAWHDE